MVEKVTFVMIKDQTNPVEVQYNVGDSFKDLIECEYSGC